MSDWLPKLHSQYFSCWSDNSISQMKSFIEADVCFYTNLSQDARMSLLCRYDFQCERFIHDHVGVIVH